MRNVVIVGAGHNSLVAAFYLAKAGWKPLVLERRDVVGGGAATEELHPGFKVPALSHEVLLWTDIAQEMELHRHGAVFIDTPVRVFAPNPDGSPLLLHTNSALSAAAIGALNRRDAAVYPRFHKTLERVSGVVGSLFASPPPDIDNPSARDLLRLLATGRRFRALGRQDGYRLLRWVPMAVADFVREWFENDLLCAALAAPGVSGTMLGPRSAGSTLVLLMREAHRQLSGGGRPVRGGPGALALALARAATAAGAEVRTQAPVDSILVERERVVGVVTNGHTVPAPFVLAGVDPKTTFLRLIEPTCLSPDFETRVRHYRSAGTLAKINLALAALPAFVGATSAEQLSGHVHIGPGIDYLERAFDHAKYGTVSAEPWLDVTVPSVLDPQLAPPGAHVMSIYAHYAPFTLRNSTWTEASGPLLQSVLSVLERVAPGVRSLVVSSQVITPLDLDREYGFHGGHVFHGELALDQLFTMRPILGLGRYDTPIRGLYLCGAGTHPGGFMSGASGRHAARELTRAARALGGT